MIANDAVWELYVPYRFTNWFKWLDCDNGRAGARFNNQDALQLNGMTNFETEMFMLK